MGVSLTTRAIAGQKIVSVRDFGAQGNDAKDDTVAFNNAIKALGTAGGTCEVPEGKYMINLATEIKMASRVHLKIHPLAELIALPSNLPRYGMIDLTGCSDWIVSGGIMRGDRDKHNYSASGTHEWGHGFQIYGAKRGSIIGTTMTNFTGDGMSIGRGGNVACDDIQIASVISTRNRRQGLSIVSGNNILVYDSEFSYTGDDQPGKAAGTAPMCGIDIEPEYQAGPVKNIKILKCRMIYNKRFGLLLERRTDDGKTGGNDIFDVEVAECEIAFNESNGMQNKGATRLMFHDNDVHDNSASGSVWTRDKDSKVYSNKFGRNYTRSGLKTQNPPFTLTGVNSKTARDILKQSGTNVQVGENYFY